MRKIRLAVSIQDFHEEGICAGDRAFQSWVDMPAEVFERSSLDELVQRFGVPTLVNTITNVKDSPHQETIDATVKALLEE